MVVVLQVKAEFLDALSNTEKQLIDYKSKWETLTEDFSKVGEYFISIFLSYHSTLNNLVFIL